MPGMSPTKERSDASMPNEENHSEQAAMERIGLSVIVSKASKSIRRTWVLGLVLILVLGLLSYVRYERSYTPVYTAKASFVVHSGSGASISSTSYYDRLYTKQLIATFPYLLSSGALQKVVADDLGLSGVPGSITAQMEGDTNLFQLRVTSSDPQMAYDILQSVVKNYPQVASYVIGITTLTQLDGGSVPTAPSNPKSPLRAVFNGFVTALAIYLVILLISVMVQRTIHDKNDLRKWLNIKHLGSIPQIPAKNRSNRSVNKILIDNPNISSDYFKSIETVQLRLNKIMHRNRMKTVLITSALMDEGKSTVACNCAMMFAKKENRVILIDGDLRNPSIHRWLNMPQLEQTKGLYHYLNGEAELSEILYQYKDTNLYVIPAGFSVNDVAQFYSGQRMTELLDQLRKQASHIILDTPPCSFMHDTTLLASHCDTGVLVIRQDYAHVNRITTTAEMLAQAGLPLAGCIINGEASESSHYGYGKYYSKYGYRRYSYGSYSHKS